MAADPYRYFRPEAKEILEGITGGALRIERGEAAPEVLREVLRLAHTLKGAAGVVRLPAIADLAHQLEEVLAPHREGGGAVPREAVDRVLRLVDEIGAALAAVEKKEEPKPGADEPAGRASFETIRVDVGDLNLLSEGITEVSVQADALRQVTLEFEDVRDRLVGLLKAVDHHAPEGRGPGPIPERMRRAVRELNAVVSRIGHRLGSHAHRVDRGLAEARKRAEGLRLLPASSLFGELERAVRDAARALGKTVTFETAGGEHRLDAHVLAQLRVALLHLIRNAVVHGIEPPEARAASGKAPAGNVRLSVERRGYRLSFRCGDDGRGVDLAAVRRAALERGLISPEEAGKLSLDESLQLIFRAGLSTTRIADLASGRGVGLDVVMDVASKLKGKVEARSEPARGTSLEIIVPVSITSIETLVVEQAGARFSLPFASVIRVLRVPRSQLSRSGQGESILHQGEAIPYCPLAALVGSSLEAEGGSLTILVLQAEPGSAALGVERLLGRRHEVIRPLPPVAGSLPLLSGASFDPEGNPGLVLDPRGVIECVRRGTGRSVERQPQVRPPVLVVDDSLTTRMLEQTILEANGYQVDLATSAEEALEMARKRRYGLMLVDVEMPGMNGFEFLDCTRADPELRHVPAILMTTRGSVEDRRRGMEAGARAYLHKGEFDEGILLRTLRGIIG